jgi:hypothetical protein
VAEKEKVDHGRLAPAPGRARQGRRTRRDSVYDRNVIALARNAPSARRVFGQMRARTARSLGCDLLALARDYTRELDQAHYLVHLTVEAVVEETEGEDAVTIDDCRAIMRRKARECGLDARAA